MKNLDKITVRAKEMYNEYRFGDFSYGRTARERSGPHFLEFLKLVKVGDRVYDIGCGIGFWMDTYHRFGISPEQIIAVDLAPANVVGLRQRGYEAYEASVLALPFKDSVSDYTICHGVIMLTADPLKALKELVRITKTGGKLYISVYNKWHPWFYFVWYLTSPIRWMYWRGIKKIVTHGIYYMFWPLLQIATFFTMGKGLNEKSCRTIFMDQVITPSIGLYSQVTLRQLVEAAGGQVIEFGYSRWFVMLSAIINVLKTE